MLTQREDAFAHCSSALARAVPQYGQQLQHNCEKATVVHARFGFFSAVELAVTFSTLHIIHLQFRRENSSSAVFSFGIWSACIAGVDTSVSKENTMLKISFTETPAEEKWVLDGRLTAPWVRELRAPWKKNHRRHQQRACIIDLNEITFIDKGGERLLRVLEPPAQRF